MAVVDVTQMWSRDGGSISTNPKDFTFLAIQRTRGFQVLTDDPDTSHIEVENAVDVRELGELYPGSTYARCVSLKPTRLGPVFWLVEASYEGDNEFELNRPIIRKASVTSSEPIDRDWNGRAIVNVNDEAVEGLSRDVSDTVITVTRNFESVNDDLVLDYLEATNSDTWYGYTVGRARLTSYQAEQMFRNERDVTGYWKVTATIQCRRGYGDTTPDKAWHKRYRNEGLYEKVTIAGSDYILRAVDDAGAPVTKPVLLKEDGTRETDPDNAHFLFAQVYGSLPYNALGLL
jgi:hypothetical protein